LYNVHVDHRAAVTIRLLITVNCTS